MTEEEYLKVKEKMAALAEEYKEQIDEMLRHAKILSVTRSQINNCIELISIYEETNGVPLETEG